MPEVTLLLLPSSSQAWRWTDPDSLGWPYWAFAWAGGQALARFVLDHPERVKGRRVLSFGAGGGLEALAAARAGASSVWCSRSLRRVEGQIRGLPRRPSEPKTR